VRGGHEVVQPGVRAELRASTAAAPEPVLELSNLHHRWRGNRPPVLGGVSLSLPAGTTTAIAGRNGAGKTTLLRLAAGILVPQVGSVRLCGLDPVRDRGPFQRQLGYLSAGDRGLYARMTVAQHLDYWARLAYVPRDERKRRVADGVVAFELQELAGQRVDRMSMGQRQRVRIAMAFVHLPRVVLLDEPRNSLDDDGCRVLNDQIAAATRSGAAVLWCSPHGEDRLPDLHAAYWLQDGHLVPNS
jgi:ABC-2 type transport system ATP-binding protein